MTTVREPIVWLTLAQVEAAARESKAAALACSQEHWRQLSRATEAELREAIASLQTSIGSPFCALCRRSGVLRGAPCAGCPLAESGHQCARNESGVYRRAGIAKWRWEDKPTHDAWRDWQAAARRMYEVLMKCRS